MFKLVKQTLWLLLLASFGVLAAPAKTAAVVAPQVFQAGTDYELISQNNQSNAEMTQPKIGNVQVVEFFSYGCPACFHFEPTLEKWLATKPQNVTFERIPVQFEPGWDVLAQAYYTAKNLNVVDKMTPVIFNAIHVQGQNLTNEATLEQLFVKEGVSKEDFTSAFHFAPGIDAQILRGDSLMRSYNIYEIPTIVIDGKYKTNIRMTNGDANRMLQVVNYLIKKEQTGT